MALPVTMALGLTTCRLLQAALIGPAAGLKLCVAVWTMQAKPLGSLVGIVAIEVLYARSQRLVMPYQRVRVENLLGVLTSPKKRGSRG
jgi:hypothetical protein